MKAADLALEATRLKALPRTGWVQAGVADPESVAAHSWGVAFLALLLCPPGLDRGRVLAMAVLHDLAEVDTGDLTPEDGVSPDEKHHRERKVMLRLLGEHPHLLAVWEEAEARVSPEAKFLKDLDRLDMGVQARRYQDRGEVARFLAATSELLDRLDETP